MVKKEYYGNSQDAFCNWVVYLMLNDCTLSLDRAKKHVGKYMYMHETDKEYAFKNIMSREYYYVPKN